MPRFKVRMKIDDFIYEVNANTIEEAKQMALEEMFSDIHHNPSGIVSEFRVRKVRCRRREPEASEKTGMER